MGKQNFLFYNTDPSESIYANLPFQPEPYHTSIVPTLSLPFGKFKDANMFLDDYMRNSNSAMRSLAIAKMSPELRNNEMEMLKVIHYAPEVVMRAGVMDSSHLVSEKLEFLEKALHSNPNVYWFLPEQMQKDGQIVDAYAYGMMTRDCNHFDVNKGAWDFYNQQREPDSNFPVFGHAIHPNCDLTRFFSVENYQKAHEEMIKAGIFDYSHKGDPRDWDSFPQYANPIAYIQMANQYAAQNPQLMEKYRLAEARNIEANIHELAKIVEESPYSQKAKMIAEAAVHASLILEKNPTLNIRGQLPRTLNPMAVVETIKEAEKRYYEKEGQTLRRYLEDHRNGHPYRADYIDFLMEQAEKHPEMGITKEEQSAWWSERGEAYREAKENGDSNKINHLERYAKDHEEMRLGEQLVIEGFDSFDLSNQSGR